MFYRKRHEGEKEKVELTGEEDLPDKKRLKKEEKFQVEDMYQKGAALADKGKEDDAIKYFVQVLTVDPVHVSTQEKLAMLYMQKKMFNAASALYRQLISLTEDARHYSHLGLSLYQQNEHEQARDAYQKAVDLDPKKANRFVSLSQVYRAMDQGQNAIIALNKALELEKAVDSLLLLADLQIDNGYFEEARENLKKVLEVDEERAEDVKILAKKLRKVEKESL